MFSIIIPVFNDWSRMKSIVSIIEMLSEKDNILVEIVIVDNGSDFVDFDCDEFKFVKIFECLTPGSYAARNLGVEKASGDYCVFIDSDCTPTTSWLSAISDFYAIESNGRKLLAGDVKMISNDSGNVTFPEAYDICLGLPQKRYVRNGHAVTANLTIPRTVFEFVGKFDESFFSGGDIDFCMRARNKNISLEFVEDAIVNHPARNSVYQYSVKAKRLIGSRMRRVTPTVRFILGFRYAFSFLLDAIRIFSNNKLCFISIKAFLFSFVISYLNVKFYFYYLSPKSTCQR